MHRVLRASAGNAEKRRDVTRWSSAEEGGETGEAERIITRQTTTSAGRLAGRLVRRARPSRRPFPFRPHPRHRLARPGPPASQQVFMAAHAGYNKNSSGTLFFSFIFPSPSHSWTLSSQPSSGSCRRPESSPTIHQQITLRRH